MPSPRVPFTAHALSLVLGNPKAKVVLSQLSGGVELRGGMHRVRLNRRTSKGQLLEGDEAILFMGSPCLTGVEEMKKLEIFMSDYPTHDPTADETLVAAARQVLATERLQQAEHNNRTLKRTLAQTLASHHEAMPMLQVESAGHQLLDLLESLLVGEEVEPEALLAARAALLKSGGNVWKPLDVDWSAVGADKEVNQSLARMLGTGGGSDSSLDSGPGVTGDPVLDAFNGAASSKGFNERCSRDWDSGPSHDSPHSPAASGNLRIGLAAYRRASASRCHLMTAPDVMEAHPQGSGATSPRTTVNTPAVKFGRVSKGVMDSNACNTAPDNVAVAALAAQRQGLGSAPSAGTKTRERRKSWLQVRVIRGHVQVQLECLLTPQ